MSNGSNEKIVEKKNQKFQETEIHQYSKKNGRRNQKYVN
jgi:hypothetical protein